MAPPNHSAQYSPAHYFQHYHQQHQNPLYQPPPPSSPSRISVVIDGTNQPPDYTDYYSMYPAKAGEFVFKQFEGFKDFTMNTAKSGLGVGEKSVFWLYTKITKWSRNWFTHIFLFLMLFLYSVAGAALFIAVEGKVNCFLSCMVIIAMKLLSFPCLRQFNYRIYSALPKNIAGSFSFKWNHTLF